MTAYYSYYEKFSKKSLGGTMIPVSKDQAKDIFNRNKRGSKIKSGYKRSRQIQFRNGNYILIYLGEQS